MKRLFWHFSKSQKALLAFFVLIFLISFGGLIWRFYEENTVAYSAEGGTLTEGAVAIVDQNFFLNPLLVTGNNKATSVEADIARLIFAGLMRYDPSTGTIEDHLADHTLSPDKKTYTFTLKENLTWHNGEPLIADDVIFTYKSLIQHPDFPNKLLNHTFKGVEIEKVDDKTVTFTLPVPYKFFLTNFTIGLVPQHLLQEVPVESLQYDVFNQDPIGAGPYRFRGIGFSEESPITTISLEAFPEYISGKPKISFFEFQLFPNVDLMVNNISKLDALHPKLKSQYEFLEDDKNFKPLNFIIPQYAAVFINMDSPKLSGEENQKVRLALQLATDKEEILKIVSGKRIDTPLLETDLSEWLFEFDTEKAAGALKDSGWLLPEIPKSSLSEEEDLPDDDSLDEIQDEQDNQDEDLEELENEESQDANEDTPLEANAEDLKYVFQPVIKNNQHVQSQEADFLLGSFPEGTQTVRVNGYNLQLFTPEKQRFSYKLNFEIETITKGKNTYTVEFFDKNGKKLDEEVVTLYVDEDAKSAFFQIFPSAAAAGGDKAPVVRQNEEGERLSLRMTTISSPSFYPEVATALKSQWAEVGIDIEVEILDQEKFVEAAIIQKDYDLLLYGQNLGYNPDAFSFWHFSQADEGGSNLSKYKSFEAGILLEEIRQTHNEEERNEKLSQLREIIKKDVPAVFLFSPYYTMPVNSKVQNLEVNYIALFPDKFSNVEDWHIRESRTFVPKKNWLSFVPWLFTSFKNTFF